jgi:hypothetical protein
MGGERRRLPGERVVGDRGAYDEGVEAEGWCAERDVDRERKSLRNEVHNANAVVWGPV